MIRVPFFIVFGLIDQGDPKKDKGKWALLGTSGLERTKDPKALLYVPKKPKQLPIRVMIYHNKEYTP